MTYGDLEDKLLVVVGGLEGVQNRGQLGTVELDWKASQQRLLARLKSFGGAPEWRWCSPSTTAPMTC